jgi:hypothetical protein
MRMLDRWCRVGNFCTGDECTTRTGVHLDWKKQSLHKLLIIHDELFHLLNYKTEYSIM